MRKSLLRSWLSKKKLAPSPENTREVSDYPLSYGQQRIWLLEQLYPTASVYNYAEYYRLEGNLNIAVLQQACTAVIHRHDSLRTVFREGGDGTIRQWPLPNPPLNWIQEDIPPDSDDQESFLRMLALRPFNLAVRPPLRFHFLTLGEDRHLLLLVMHHILADRDSMVSFREDLDYAYRALQRGQRPEWPVAAPSYGAFAHTQRTVANTGEGVDWWAKELEGAPTGTMLPPDLKPLQVPSFAGAAYRARLFSPTAEALRAKCRQLSITPFTLMSAMVSLTVGQYAAQADVLLASPVSNREVGRTVGGVGFYNETMILRHRRSVTQSVDTYLLDCHQGFVRALRHKDVPLEDIVRRLNPNREVGKNPLTQVMCVYTSLPANWEAGKHIITKVHPLYLGRAKYAVTVFISDKGAGEGIDLTVEYAVDLYSGERIAGLVKRLTAVLQILAEEATVTIGDLESLWRMDGWQIGQGKAATPTYESVIQRIWANVTDRPHHPAVRAGMDQLTYGELGSWVHTITLQLQRAGVVPGDRVGLLTARSSAMIAGMLGIQAAGASYLPLDGSYPPDRLTYTVRDANLRILLVQDGLASSWSAPKTVRSLVMSEQPDELTSWSPNVVDHQSPAYLIYTSGSSGKPKGVVIHHANLAASTWARREVYQTSPAAFLLLSSYAFDSAVAGIYWTLCEGGTLVIAPDRLEQDMEAAGGVIAQYGITHTLMLPKLYRELLAYAKVADLRSLHTVIVAGESCPIGLVHEHFAHPVGKNIRLYNEYGPTEATVWATVNEVQATTDEAVAIGRPVPGYQVYVIDATGDIVPPGVAGEIAIAGLGLSAGYHNRPILSENRFPYLKMPAGGRERIYRTGDRGRYDLRGWLYFLGRMDRQIKLRGYRLEPEEVKMAMLEHLQIQQAEVVYRNDRCELVGFYVSEPGNEISPEEIRIHLSDQLPAYAVPSRFIELPGLPTLPNGKTDTEALYRQSLPAPRAEAYIPEPSGTVEAQLLTIWRNVLGVADVGIHDNYFRLGGDSIRSIQITGQARKRGIRLPPAALFTHQTVSELAAVATRLDPLATEVPAADGEQPANPLGSSDLERIRRHFDGLE